MSIHFLTFLFYTPSKGGENMAKSKRGFASMDSEKQRQIASKGGKASGGNFKNNPERAREAGRKGGSK